MSDEIKLKLSETGILLQKIITYNDDLAANPKSLRWEEPVVPYLQSEPGVGKTSICMKAALDANHQFVGFIGAQYDPAEMAGFLFFDKDTRATWRMKPDFLPADANPKKPDPSKRFFVLCDEFAQMSMMQKNIMAQLIQERRLGEHHLAAFSTLALAGNRAADRAGVQPDPTHVTDRVFIINVMADREDWEVWALQNEIRPEIISYLKFRPHFFSNFDPAAKKNATPRGWAKVSTFLHMNLPPHIELAAIQGQVGPGPAADFMGYLKVYRDLPDIDMIIADPKRGMVPDVKKQPDVVYAVCGALSSKATTKNIGNIIQYSERLPGEFSVMLIKDALTRDQKLKTCKEVLVWLSGRGHELAL